MIKRIVNILGTASIVAGSLLPLLRPLPAHASTTWNVGDVFAGVAGGSYKVYDNAGVFKETISDGLGGFTTGCAFNNTLDKLYTTNFSSTKVVVYNDASPHTIAQTVDPTLNGGGLSESVVFAANGDFYVGNAGGNTDILRFNAAGVFQQTYNVATENVGSDWMDLAADQKTIFYTSEGRKVMRYDTLADAQLADFANLSIVDPVGTLFALRLLPPGDGSNGLLVADRDDIKRLDSLGALAQTYDVAGENGWFSLNLDPNGTSFWAGDFGTNNFYRFNIANGAVEVGPINTGAGTSLFGLCLKGEPTAAQEDTRRMTGGGTIPSGANTLEGKHGFELHCDASVGPNRLEVNWGKGNKFHLENLTSASCVDQPAIDESPPNAGFDTYTGTGTGRLNGVSGATAKWRFVDAGEPGVGDFAIISITDGVNTYNFSGNLKNGNQQAHAE